jgi:hypothetical protein
LAGVWVILGSNFIVKKSPQKIERHKSVPLESWQCGLSNGARMSCAASAGSEIQWFVIHQETMPQKKTRKRAETKLVALGS